MPSKEPPVVTERYAYGLAKVSATGSVAIPAGIRKAEGIKPGDTVAVVDIDGKVFIQKPPTRETVEQALRKIGA